MTTVSRQVEKLIVNAVVKEALKQGYALQVAFEGEDFTGITKNKKEIVETLFDVDMAYLYLFNGKDVGESSDYLGHSGWVLFVFGNDDGTTVISDYVTSLEDRGILTEANRIAEAVENGNFTIKV
jgi:hypothetical protein